MANLRRDKDACLSRLVEDKDGRVLVRAPCRIQVPERWMSVGLGTIGAVTTLYGFFPIIFEDDTYGVLNLCTLVDISPSRATMVTVEDESYYEFHFDQGDTLLNSTTLVKIDTLTFNIIDEFIMKGKVPWWVTVDDLCGIFDTAAKHAGSNIGSVPETIEFLVGIIARKTEERAKSLRHTAKVWKDYDVGSIEFIPLKSVLESVNNTVSKLSGAYFNDAVLSATTNPSTKSSNFEKILRT
jgi:hypothetical protein